MANQAKEEIVSEPVDISEEIIERRAQAYIRGNDALNKNKQLKAKLEAKITERIGKKGKYLTDKLFELIDGVSILYEDPKEGKPIRYYKQPPNLQAIQYAIDRILGKPTQKSVKAERTEGLITVEHIIKGLAEPGRQQQNDGKGEK